MIDIKKNEKKDDKLDADIWVCEYCNKKNTMNLKDKRSKYC